MTLDFFKYVEVPPHPSLQDVVTHYRVTGAKRLTPFIFPDYSPIFQGLIFNLCPLDDIILQKREQMSLKYKVYFVGQAISPSVLFSSSLHLDLIAVNFTPIGIFQLTGIDLDSFTDQIIDAEAVFGKDINELYEKIMTLNDKTQILGMIDEFLCMKARERKKHNRPCILTSLSLLNQHAGNISVRMLQKATNTNPRTLERSFRSEIGMSPKMYQRLLRFNQAKQYIEENQYTAWWEVAVRFGFYDPSHFISEFQTFAGQTPKEYINRLLLL
ncbi:AraC family transcriptional regulator [Sphingobacterium sp. SGG-5]|uniref:helix-turn-helix domain-containing protein n=1 Tax=Sphingobacterium sp. SGG-5 TaxID=2710881 RepID=UPI0013EDEE1D|nr:helix-turn-helix domain-containing protein [Sphingobacterium sp. SGG-5]NGM62213.1 AraC family transcriptional regulator [Sphingobacterium sp. SGG-5]